MSFTFTSIFHHHYDEMMIMTNMISAISNHCICGKDKEKEMVMMNEEDHGDDDSNYCICGKDKEKEMVANKGSSCTGLVLLDLLLA